MDRILIQKNVKKSPVKPMNAANNLPMFYFDTYDGDMKKLRMPYLRTHDARFMERHLVDIPAIFPDFSADADDPASYDFAFTDVYVQKIVSYGSEPFFRLGVTIENYVSIKPYDIYPPTDNLKWAKICEHIIRHYNEGWSNGFRFGITYWEIWNEPENCGIGPQNQMWTGTFEEYLELYRVSANHLKKCFPNLKIGGFASCGFYGLFDAHRRTPEEADVMAFYIKCFEDFLTYVTSPEHPCPLDFFSWHTYTNVDEAIGMAKYVRETLDAHGLQQTESVLDEWNPDIDVRGKREDASNICAMITSLQDAGVDLLMYYDLRINTSYNGVFNPVTRKPFLSYYAFLWFADLVEVRERVSVKFEGAKLYGEAVYRDGQGILLFTNNTNAQKTVRIEGVQAIGKVRSVSKKMRKTVGENGEILLDVPPFEVAEIFFE